MNNETMRNGQMAPIGKYRPALTLYHPNGKGTGGAMELKLHPAHDDVDGSIMLRSVGGQKKQRTAFAQSSTAADAKRTDNVFIPHFRFCKVSDYYPF